MSKNDNKINFSIDLKQLGEIIASKRDELGYTQEDLAELASTSKNTISTIENGQNKSGCKIDLIARIAVALDTSVDSLLGLDKTKDTATLTDRQKLNIIKDFINLVKPKFELEEYTTEEAYYYGKSAEDVEFIEVTHYKSSLHIDNEILTAYLKAYDEITNVKVSNASAATMDKVNNLLLNDFNEFMQKAITFKDNTMLLTDDYRIRDNEIIEVVPF